MLQRAYTSAPGEGGVVSFKDYDRKFSSHAVSSCYLYWPECTRHPDTASFISSAVLF